MAYRIACFGLALGALSACTFTTQAGPQPANGYYAPMPPPAAPVAASPVYLQPAPRPERTAAAPVATPVATAPSSPPAAARPPTAFRPPTAGAAQRPVLAPPAAETPVATTPPAATAPAQTSGPLSPAVRRPVGNQKAETRDKTSDSQVK